MKVVKAPAQTWRNTLLSTFVLKVVPERELKYLVKILKVSPAAHRMENPWDPYHEENPEQQETGDEVSRCIQTPARPEN